MLKCALASGEMALFVCHSAEHHFAEKTFLTESADRGKAGGGRERERELELVVLGVTCGHTEPCPLWVRDIDIWKR